MEKISVIEFAERKGVSRTLVLRGISEGKIKAQQVGRGYQIDWHTQAQAWDDNYKHPQKRPQNIGGGRPRSDGMPVATPRGAPERPAPADDDGEPKQRTLADIQRHREAVKLQFDLEKLRLAQGKAVLVAEVEAEWSRHVIAAKNIIMGIPNECKTRRSDLPLEVVTLIEKVCREALEELANGKR